MLIQNAEACFGTRKDLTMKINKLYKQDYLNMMRRGLWIDKNIYRKQFESIEIFMYGFLITIVLMAIILINIK